MEAKEVRNLMEAYASVYEGYGKKKKKMHDCASHVKHEEYGLGDCIKEMHTLDEEGNVTHYDVQFEHGIVENVPASELEVLISEVHEHFVNDEKNAEVIEEKKKIATGSGKKAMPSKKERSKLAKRARAGEDIGKPGKGFQMVAKKAAKQYGSKEAGERVAAAAMFRNEEVETDLFDYLLEYLVAEGYADTNKAALAIMANMSEEWKQSIVEADSVAAMRERAAKRRQQRYGKQGGGGRDDFRPYTKDDYDNPKPGYGSGASSQAKDA